MKEFKMINSPIIEQELGIDPEKAFCRICKFENLSFFDSDGACSKCKMVITRFEAKVIK